MNTAGRTIARCDDICLFFSEHLPQTSAPGKLHEDAVAAMSENIAAYNEWRTGTYLGLKNQLEGCEVFDAEHYEHELSRIFDGYVDRLERWIPLQPLNQNVKSIQYGSCSTQAKSLVL